MNTNGVPHERGGDDAPRHMSSTVANSARAPDTVPYPLCTGDDREVLVTTTRRRWNVYWAVVAATAVNYLAMLLWSLPRVSEMAGGGVPFDMRPAGYSYGDAREFLTAITDAGREFYLGTQQLLDFTYPILASITLAIPLVRLVPRTRGWALAGLAIAAGVFDLLENRAVAIMLRVEPDALTEAMVSSASRLTLAKSISMTGASVALLIVLCIAGLARLKDRRARAGSY